jgi:predicted transcriptional regulator
VGVYYLLFYYLLLLSFRAHSAKQEALEAIQRLPDTADTEEIMYRLYVLENIRRGQQDAAEGKTQPAEEVLKDIQTW